MNRLLLLALLGLDLSAAQAQTTAKLPRTALLLGVGSYDGAKYKGKTIHDLPGVTTVDLPKMQEKLESLGFSVTTVSDPTLAEAKTAVDAFSARIKTNPGVSLFYFSGHGGEHEGKNYLIPRGASIGTVADLSDEALSAQRVLNGMEESGAAVNLVFLDCCREDLGKSVGGAEMAPLKARGSFIGFATRSGDFADPEEQGSPYTRFLLKHLGTPGLSVPDMYGCVAEDVKDYSKRVLGEERTPGYYSELAGAPFYLVPGNGLQAPVVVGNVAEMAALRAQLAKLEQKAAEGGSAEVARMQSQLDEAQEKLAKAEARSALLQRQTPLPPSGVMSISPRPALQKPSDLPTIPKYSASKPYSAYSDPVAPAARKILETYKSALVVVTVPQTLIGLDGAPAREAQRRTMGVSIRPDGLLVVSNSAIDGSVPSSATSDSNLESGQPATTYQKSRFGEIEISYGDTTIRKGTLVGKNVDSDIAFILPDTATDNRHVDLTSHNFPRVGQEVIALSRESACYGYMPTVRVGNIGGIFKGTCTYYTSSCGDRQGVPVFDIDGNILGITCVRIMDGKASGVLGIVAASELLEEMSRISIKGL
jgi:S1-C subfamily serine protease